MLTAGVAIDKATLNFDKLFSYKISDEFIDKAKVGSIVLVPFGKGDTLRMGMILSIQEEDENQKIKSIIDLKNEDTIITKNSINLVKYLKETVFCTYFDAVKAVFPYGALYKIQDNKLIPQLVGHLENAYTANLSFNKEILKHKKQIALYDLLLDKELSAKEISNYKIGKSVIDNLVNINALITKKRDKDILLNIDVKKTKDNVELSNEQEKVFNDIININDNKPHLIYGVTSSGKSMIYIKLIQKALSEGKGAMLLVPEISLTPQMIHLLKSYFGDIVSVIHSKLSNTQRITQYNRIVNKKARVVVGTRSAVFAPIENLGVIIIDEEHEKTFKSENTPRYSAIRLASFLAKQESAKLVLASATPSVESYYLAQSGFYNLHVLKNRFNDMPMPEVEIIDMSKQSILGDTAVVSSVIIKYIAQNIIDEKQSIILINRRGYQTVGICNDCKEAIKCEDCSVNLVKHKTQNKLSCHYCARSYDIIDVCPNCKGEIKYMGYGTQHIEEYISQVIPASRILRMDADTTTKNTSHQEMLDSFSKKEYDILIGTQMVAKGLDFKDVNLVCVLGIDSSLNQPSFNANEYAFSLMTQVIGRAGRQEAGAKAVIQTFDSENPIINLAKNQDYENFYKSEIAYRKLNTYPPYCSLCTVAFTSSKEVRCAKDATVFLNILKKYAHTMGKQPLVVLGPSPFDVEMVSKIYRWKLTIKCINNKLFRDYLNKAIDEYLKDDKTTSGIYVNMNPLQEWFWKS